MQIPEPTEYHRWLQGLVGDWTFEHESPGQPGGPTEKLVGSERVRALGELWIVMEGGGNMPGGGAMTYQLTLGYDPLIARFVGSWVGSVMTTQFVYEGELDHTKGVLPLNTLGPSWTDPAKTVRYQDVIEFDGKDRRAMWSQAQADDGSWQRFMHVTYHRA